VFINGLEDAWEYFGGVPARVVIDNLKAAVALRTFVLDIEDGGSPAFFRLRRSRRESRLCGAE
jgi:hypothetical protein